MHQHKLLQVEILLLKLLQVLQILKETGEGEKKKRGKKEEGRRAVVTHLCQPRFLIKLYVKYSSLATKIPFRLVL